jgi:NAD+ kinase
MAGRIRDAHAEHERTLGAVREALRRNVPAWTEVAAHSLDAGALRRLRRADVVLSVGGDGTFLAAAHGVAGGVLIGVNSAPRDSVGHFCCSDRRTLPFVLDEVLSGRLPPTRLARLEATLDGRRLETALNDVLVANASPAATSRYVVAAEGAAEEHRSSGVWIATPAGSTAGIRSSGGRRLPLGSRRLQFRVRELYRETGRRYRLTQGLISPDHELRVSSRMVEGRVWVDGGRWEHRFPFGSRLVVRTAHSALRIVLPSRLRRPGGRPGASGEGR